MRPKEGCNKNSTMCITKIGSEGQLVGTGSEHPLVGFISGTETLVLLTYKYIYIYIYIYIYTQTV